MRICIALFLKKETNHMGVEAKCGYKVLKQPCNPNRLGDNTPVALVRCSLRSVKNKYGCDWTTKKVAKSIKKGTQLRIFSSLSMLRMVELGQSPLHPDARRWGEAQISDRYQSSKCITHLASIPTTRVCDPWRSCT